MRRAHVVVGFTSVFAAASLARRTQLERASQSLSDQVRSVGLFRGPTDRASNVQEEAATCA
jgi:hypothetical protein